MTKIQRLISAAVLVTAMLTCTTTVVAKCTQEMNAGIQRLMDESRKRYDIPAIAVSVSCPGELRSRDYMSGTTTIDGKALITPKTLFQVGSETKPFISAVILLLESEGKLSIDDTIGKWLPELPTRWKELTIKQILNQTTGLYEYFDEEAAIDVERINNWHKHWTPEELLSYVIDKPFYFNPGDGWEYSNTNYIIAGLIIERVTGNSVEKELNDRLIQPLHLVNTFYLPYTYNNTIMHRIAHGYSLRHLFPDEPRDITDVEMSFAGAAGAIVSNTQDTVIWIRKILDGSVLPEKQQAEFMSLVDIDSGQPISHGDYALGYGLGIFRTYDLSDGEVWAHPGASLGYRAITALLKCDDIAFSVTINHSDKFGIDFQSFVIQLATYIQMEDKENQCYNAELALSNHKNLKSRWAL